MLKAMMEYKPTTKFQGEVLHLLNKTVLFKWKYLSKNQTQMVRSSFQRMDNRVAVGYTSTRKAASGFLENQESASV